MNRTEKNELIQLFEHQFNEKVVSFEILPPSGSYREYCRMQSEKQSVIGVVNADLKENTAFITFTNHFYEKELPVPRMVAVSSDLKKYLLQDLGNTTLFDFLSAVRKTEGFSETIISEYKKVLKVLPKIQVIAGKDLDYSVCYPRGAFDKQSMMWDLNYFKYYFLKLAKINFDEQALEDDFQQFSNYLLSADSDYFMYRDFQSRNVMLKNNEVYFIDYQGGRKGPLQYDLASLLYDGKADIPADIRIQLREIYLDELRKYIPVNEKEFTSFFKGFVLIRIMQAMGTYGFRGFYEKKEHFLKSIPFALKNLHVLLGELDLPVELPELTRVLEQLVVSPVLNEIGQEKSKLTVRISSFSYKMGIPADPSGNGGGFVFDCRAINNPGRYNEYKLLTGRDLAVQEFLEQKSEMNLFLSSVKNLVKQSVHNYLERSFTHLSISFGCTGGKHRSVYAAEKIALFVQNNFPVEVVLVHQEEKNW